MSELTFDRASELLRYDPENGKLYWKVNRRGAAKAGDEAGCERSFLAHRTHYRQIGIDGKLYLAHRVCWLLHYGVLPKNDIDHLDCNGVNNRIENLRDVPNAINQRNKRMFSNNASGVTGVHWYKRRGKWCAYGWFDGKQKYLGYFADIADAEAAVREFRAKHGYTDRHGEAE